MEDRLFYCLSKLMALMEYIENVISAPLYIGSTRHDFHELLFSHEPKGIITYDDLLSIAGGYRWAIS